MKVSIILRDRSRMIFAKTISKFFDVLVFKLPEHLPDFIEEFEFPDELFRDVILSYAFHPDVNLELVKKANEKDVKCIIIAGKYKFVKRCSNKIKVLVGDACCSHLIRNIEFFEKFGIPEFKVEIKDNLIENVEVVRSAPCGATFFVANKLKGVHVSEAPMKAGYFTQLYCLGSRGTGGAIHKAANIHKLAIERAIKRESQGGL